MEAGFDLRTLPVILMGGGAATVMRNVSERDGLCRAFLLGDDKVNAEGFEQILEQMLVVCNFGDETTPWTVPENWCGARVLIENCTATPDTLQPWEARILYKVNR